MTKVRSERDCESFEEKRLQDRETKKDEDTSHLDGPLMRDEEIERV